MISERSIVVVTDRQVSSEFLDDETAVLDVHEGTYYLLNPVGAQIWSIIQTPKSVREVIDKLLDEYDVPPQRCTREVVELLDELAQRKLIEVRDGPT